MAKRKNKLIQPFLKWAGGKRYLLPEIDKRVPSHNTYHEPFVGGGAVLFFLQSNKSYVNDVNIEVINVYRVIKDNLNDLLKELKNHAKKNSSEYFYTVRDYDRDFKKFQTLNDIQKAARIIYLNKTCFNGLFRVNSQGQFNAPYGKYKNPNIVNEDVLKAVNKFLNNTDVQFSTGSFEKSIKKIKKGDFVYLDPPYDPISDTSSFTGYSLDGFTRADQEKLKKYCDEIHKKGAKFLLSNSATNFIQDLYKKYTIEFVDVPRSINSNGSKRGKVKEVLVRNYELE